MSHQKMLFTVCFAAGLVALVSAQTNWDPNKCSNGAQEEFRKYTNNVSSLLRSLVSDLSSQGNQALNIEGFSNDANTLIAQITSLSDTSNGLDMQQIMETYYKIVQTQIKMGTQMMNPRVGISVMRIYMNATTKLMTLNSDFMMNMSSQCLPSRRISTGSN